MGLRQFALVFLLVCLVLTGCIGPRFHWPDLPAEVIEVEREVIAQRRFDRQMADAERLHRVSWPLLRTIADEMPGVRQRLAIGVRWMHAADGAVEPDISGLSPVGLRIVSVAPASPAQGAGLQPSDVVLEVNGELVPEGAGASLRGGRKMARALTEEAPVSVLFLRNGERSVVALSGVSVADFGVGPRNDNRANARALIRRVQVNEGMMRFVRNDEELAFIVAHELAHSVMRHHRAIAWNYLVGTLGDLGVFMVGGMSPGFGGVAGALSRSPDFEREADLLALQWMRAAGFDISEALDFWPRLAARSDRERSRRLWLPTHPPAAERAALMRYMAEQGINKRADSPRP